HHTSKTLEMKSQHLVLNAALFAVGLLVGYMVWGSSNPAADNSTQQATTSEVKTETESKVAQETKQEETSETVINDENLAGNSASDESPEVDPSGPTDNPIVLPSGQACFANDEELSFQLSLFAEEMEKKKVMYNNREPEKLADCSGIFHRTLQFVASSCDQYLYPKPTDARDSRSLANWYNAHENLVFIKDAVAQRNVIKPGAVMFFGGSGKRYNHPPKDEVLKGGIIEHIGVVTEVKKDEQGNVIGYTMFHGRRPGKAAERSHYHSIEPPRLGYPPLGNWNQQLLAVAYVMTPKGA
ncbi:MAG: hypothetical protein D6816_09210, partial [Bacteroidetes bacterium]